MSDLDEHTLPPLLPILPSTTILPQHAIFCTFIFFFNLISRENKCELRIFNFRSLLRLSITPELWSSKPNWQSCHHNYDDIQRTLKKNKETNNMSNIDRNIPESQPMGVTCWTRLRTSVSWDDWRQRKRNHWLRRVCMLLRGAVSRAWHEYWHDYCESCHTSASP